MFLDTVDNLLQEFQRRLSKNIIIPWGWLFTKLLNLLARYPTGVTKAILLAELETSWKKVEKFHWKGALHGSDSLQSMVLTKHLSPQAVFEVYLHELTFVEGTQTRIGVMRDSNTKEGGSYFTVDMYLHQKLNDEAEEIMAQNYKMRFTGCRLFEGRRQKSVKLLPSESFVVVIDQESAQRLSKCFSTLEGLQDLSESRYIDGVKVKIVAIGKPESIHYQNGQTVNKISVTVLDDVDIQTTFVLWEEYLIMKNLFDEGDTLFIKSCFLVPDPNECFTLEYGPETVIFCYPADHEQAMVSNHTDNPKLLYILKDTKGKLDYGMYPKRLSICDVKSEMTNLTLFGQVACVGSRKLLKGDGISMVQYELKIEDGTGDCLVLVTEQFKGGTVVYCGQFVLMKNLFVSSDGSAGFTLHLDSEKGGKMWNVSVLEGWLTTTSLCSVTPLASLHSSRYQHCVVRGIISDLKARDDGNSIVRAHCSCNSKLTELMEDMTYCGKCNSAGMVEMSAEASSKLFGLDKFWCWQYDLRMTIFESDEDHVGLSDSRIEMNITNEVAGKLLQLSAHQFQSLGENGQRRVFECTLGQECYCGVSTFNGEFFVSVVSQV